MPKRYGREFRRTICERLVAGERVQRAFTRDWCLTGDVALVGASGLIDAGLSPGTTLGRPAHP